MPEQFTCLAAMKRRFAAAARRHALRTDNPEVFQTWRRNTRAALRQLIGYDTFIPTEANPRVLETADAGDHTRELMAIDTEPGVTMPFFVLKPKDTRGRLQPVLAPHGHGGGGKAAVAGAPTNEQVADVITDFDYDYGRKLAQAGFIVFCPDARGFGQRKEPLAPADPLGGSCRELNNMAIPLGQTVTGMWTWDLHRLADYVATRDDCDMDRLACVGLSGGGLQTLWTTALDERFRAAVVSGYFYGYEQSLLEMHGNCSCNYVPHLWEHVDMGDIAALIAPRRLMIETGNVDPLNGRGNLDNVRSQLDITAQAYRLLQCEDALKHSVQTGPHRWYGVGVLEWLRGTRSTK